MTTTDNTPHLPPLSPARVNEAGHTWRIWNVVVPSGIKPEDLFDPAFWRLCAPRLRPLDRIEVVDDDMTYFAELLVTQIGAGNTVTMKGMRAGELQGASAFGASARNTTGARVIYRGPHRKWCVERGSDVLKEGFETEGQGNTWLSSYLRRTEAA